VTRLTRPWTTCTCSCLVALTLIVAAGIVGRPTAQTGAGPKKPRARELGLSRLIGGQAGMLDAITDVTGVEVGHTTLISGDGRLVVGKGPVRTGVTVVHPRGKSSNDPVFGAWFTLNGNGEMTGTTWLEESGILEGPVGITNTHSVGIVRDAILQWQVSRPGLQPWGLPVVAETYDGGLNDINGFHVKAEHVLSALDGAQGGAVAECRRGHRHALSRLQSWHRHSLPRRQQGARRLYGRRARAVQLRLAAGLSSGRRSRR
jgi:Peptidase family S58